MNIKEFYVQNRHSLVQFLKFGFIGGLGVFVNQFANIGITVAFRDFFNIRWNDVLRIFPNFGMRYVFIFVIFSFLVANLFNFIWNRHWTFKGEKAPFFKEYLPFLAVGSVAQIVGLAIVWLLVTPNSPVELPNHIFDNSSGLRSKNYWANLIQIVLVMPINFVVNKLWTFRIVRNKYQDHGGH